MFLDILAKFGHFRWSNIVKTVKRQIFRPRPFIWAYSQVSTTIRYKETAWKSSYFEKPLISDILANFGHFQWPTQAETVKRHIYTGQNLSYERIPRSLRPSVTTKQPGKAHVSRNRWFRTFWQISAISSGCQKTHLQAKTFHEPIPRSLRPSVTKKPPGKAHVSKNHCVWTFWLNPAISVA